jgi:hypothetical protein
MAHPQDLRTESSNTVDITVTANKRTESCDGSGETKRATDRQTDTICTIAQESNTETRIRAAAEITVLRHGRGGD